MLDLKTIFAEHIKDNEQVIWTGRPKQGILIRDVDLIAIPMSFIFLGFAMVMDYAVIYYKAGFLFLSLALILTFTLINFGILRFFRNARHRKYLYYCVTNKRILVIKGHTKLKLDTLPLKNIEGLDITAEKDGSGFITFGTVNPVWPWLFGGFYFSSQNIPGLELVPNANEVYDIITQQMHNQVNPEVVERLRPGREDLN